MTTTNRKKGHDFERRVVAAFRSHGYPNAKRHDEQASGAVLGYDIENTGRKFIGIEMDDKYFAIAKERIEKAQEAHERSKETLF